MPLPVPNLDDRDFAQLIAEARQRIAQTSPEWTDLSPSDPGMILLELFAHLTETMIYRLNRVPHKLYIEFLRLIGVRMQPPAAARVVLRFTRAQNAEQAIDIPRGTRITLNRSGGGEEPPTFVTAQALTLPAGEAAVEGLAFHCEHVEGELAGRGTGLPGLSLQLRQPPLIAATGDPLDLVVGVETTPDETDERTPAIQFRGKMYRIWREVEHFTNLGDDPFVYVADRMTGQLFFAPAARVEDETGLLGAPQALASMPAEGREIRAWYRRGGGPEGNVPAGTLTTLKDPIPGLEVTNPAPAAGGRAAETLENALIRGPQRLHSLERAVTARDYELVALSSSRAVARAKAYTRAAMWTFAAPGAVEVLLVPYLPDEGIGAVTIPALAERETEDIRAYVQSLIDERRPLGTHCLVNWARYKSVKVSARIVVRREEDRVGVRQRVLERLHRVINPLPSSSGGAGWPFGQSLRASHIFDIALDEPGVRWVDQVQFSVDEVPNRDVRRITADAFQPATWYAGAGGTLFRSVNDGAGWEVIARIGDEQITSVAVHPRVPGLLAIASQVATETGFESRIRLSRDCGETWEPTVYRPAVQVNDLAWTLRERSPVLLVATGKGLLSLRLMPGSTLEPVQVDRALADQGFYTVAMHTNSEGVVNVAVAAENLGGIYISSDGGATGTFRKIGLTGQDIRVLRVQQDGSRAFLWAGAAAAGEAQGSGCWRWELRGRQDAPEGWTAFATGWVGGSCRDIAFAPGRVFAASHRAGVLWMEPGRTNPAWQAPTVRSGLPMRDPGRFHTVDAVAVGPAGDLLLAGGIEGVFGSRDGGQTYTTASAQVFAERVTLPETWLFVSGEHEIQVVGDDEAS